VDASAGLCTPSARVARRRAPRPDRRHFSDPDVELYDCSDENVVTLAALLPRTGTTFECGDAPIEDWTPDTTEQSIPFDPDLINQQLAQLTTAHT